MDEYTAFISRHPRTLRRPCDIFPAANDGASHTHQRVVCWEIYGFESDELVEVPRIRLLSRTGLGGILLFCVGLRPTGLRI